MLFKGCILVLNDLVTNWGNAWHLRLFFFTVKRS
jgi:hypothetical protein